MFKRPYYELKISIDTTIVDSETISKYTDNVNKQQAQVELYKRCEFVNIDAGFDLFVPNECLVPPAIGAGAGLGKKVNMGIRCAMNFIEPIEKIKIGTKEFNLNIMPSGYYLYPRSSTGSKTTLRLSNSVGIIDAGYRGYIMALYDNITLNHADVVTVNKNDRLVQICSPNITYPIYPIIVDSDEKLGITERGTGGFGSTGR